MEATNWGSAHTPRIYMQNPLACSLCYVHYGQIEKADYLISHKEKLQLVFEKAFIKTDKRKYLVASIRFNKRKAIKAGKILGVVACLSNADFPI